MVDLAQKRFKVIQGLHLIKDEPSLRVLVLDISLVCNFKCLCCYSAKEQSNISGKLLNLIDYKRIIQQAKSFGVETIWFLGGRENTLSENFLEIVKFACDLDLFVLLYSNGAVLGNDNFAEKLFGLSSLDICQQLASYERFSLSLKCDSFDKESQNRLSGNSQAWQQIKTALSNIQQTDLWQSQPFGFKRFGLNSVLTKINYQNISGVFEFALKNELVYFCDRILMAGLGKENRDLLEVSNQEFAYCIKSFNNVLQRLNILTNEILINQYDQPCVLFDNFLFLLRDGQVLPCAGYYENLKTLGHISLGFFEIWQRKKKLIKNYYCSDCTDQKCPCLLYLEN